MHAKQLKARIKRALKSQFEAVKTFFASNALAQAQERYKASLNREAGNLAELDRFYFITITLSANLTRANQQLIEAKQTIARLQHDRDTFTITEIADRLLSERAHALTMPCRFHQAALAASPAHKE